ncbi:MAG: glycosyltransferase family 4 protein [Algicola sp.]|nr:glycosyltransferase family 4 protein [Algicola sp.]
MLIVASEFPPQPGGIGNHAYNLARYLHGLNYVVVVITDQRSKNGHEEFQFDQNQAFRVVRIKRRSFRPIMYFNRLLKTYQGLKQTDVVIATGKFSLWNVAILQYFSSVKTLAVIHGSEVNFKSVFLKKSIDWSLKKMHDIVAVSNYTKALVSHLEKDVKVIPNGIDLSDWNENQLSNISISGQPVLTTVGRVSSRKGQANVINHLPILIKTFPELHYHCIGIPSEARSFMNLAQSLNVESHVTFHGEVSQKVLQQMVKASDVFLMLSSETSTGDVEGFGIAVLEANALGVPAIGSKNCGIEDAIDEGQSGELVTYDNSTEVLKALEQILSNRSHYSAKARQWAAEHDWSMIIKQYDNLIA